MRSVLNLDGCQLRAVKVMYCIRVCLIGIEEIAEENGVSIVNLKKLKIY
jgi:hypothetical protein